MIQFQIQLFGPVVCYRNLFAVHKWILAKENWKTKFLLQFFSKKNRFWANFIAKKTIFNIQIMMMIVLMIFNDVIFNVFFLSKRRWGVAQPGLVNKNENNLSKFHFSYSGLWPNEETRKRLTMCVWSMKYNHFFCEQSRYNDRFRKHYGPKKKFLSSIYQSDFPLSRLELCV